MIRTNKFYGKKIPYTIWFTCIALISLLLIPISSAIVIIENPQNEYPGQQIEYSKIRSKLIGYVFPSIVENNIGLSIDENSNGIEDFIEINSKMYYKFEYLDCIILLKNPPSDFLIKKLQDKGVIIDQKFTIIDAIGASIPIDALEDVGKSHSIEMIQSIHKIKPNLNYAVPLVQASPDKLNAGGYKGINGKGVTIAVIDSGIDDDHSTFSGRVIAFKDFVYGNDDLDPTNGMDAQDYGLGGTYHGTMVTSCAAGSGAYKGVATQANIIAVAVDTTYQMIQGIQWCVNNRNRDFNNDGTSDGPDIISMSMGVSGELSYLDNTAGSAMDNGVVFVTSAGNDGEQGAGSVTSPATSKKVIGVGATDKYNKQIASFSSRGPGPGGIIKPDIVAPGLGLNVAYPGNQWALGWGTGTSFSCPIVAGIAALLLQYDSDLGPYEIKDILLKSAEDRGEEGPDNTYGWGFANAVDALDLVLKVKSISASKSKVMEDTKVVFSATASGTNVKKFEWDFNNDGIFDKETTEGSVSHIFTNAGVYEIVAKVTNQQGKSAENSVEITVTNRKPDANLEIDENVDKIFEDQLIGFNGSQSWDTASDIKNLEFSWSFNSGQNFTNFSKEDNVYFHSFNDTGEYIIRLRVRDDNDEIDEEETTIFIENMRPLADAGDNLEVIEDELIHFSGYRTVDSESDIPTLNYSWRFGDDAKGYGMNVTHSFQINENNRTFHVLLTVKDDDSEQSQSKIKVIVHNRKPDVIVDTDKYANEDEPIILNGSGNDTSNDIPYLKYKWDFGEGVETEWIDDPKVEHVYSKVGTYHPRLYVRDNKEAISYKDVNVTIYNVPPKARFQMSNTDAEEDEIVNFNAGETFDTTSDLDTLEYIWDFGDGVIDRGIKVHHKFYNSNRYEISLTVIDDDDSKSVFKKKITITNRIPTANILVDKKVYEVNELVKFYGFLSSDTPSDFRNLSYIWNFGDDSSGKVSGINATYKFSEPGEYEIVLKIEDDNFESDVDRLKISIVKPEKDEDIFANPTFENNGLFYYAGMLFLIIILIIILISLQMYYKNRKGIFGSIEKSFTERKKRGEEIEEQQKELADGRVNQLGQSGLPVSQENFYQDLYGIHPHDFQQIIQQQQGKYPIQNQPLPSESPKNSNYPHPPSNQEQLKSKSDTTTQDVNTMTSNQSHQSIPPKTNPPQLQPKP